MFFTLQGNAYRKHADLLDQMFRLRKRVFCDQRRWNVPVVGDWERDAYDDLSPVYVVWSSADKKTLLGAIRLLPTTGPTLLHDVFSETFPDTAGLVAPNIWEATRCCVDTEALKVHHPQFSPLRAFGVICLAAAEVAFTHGIDTLISNYEPHVRRLYRQIGADITEIGAADGFGRHLVCCGAFEISAGLLSRMRAALSIAQPLLEGVRSSGQVITRIAA
jgi:N-acyl-L-homoserine lactone synthetase